MRYEIFIGYRYLKAKTRMSFVPIITFISVAGVAVGVMALVVVISVMNGFDTDLRKKILGNHSHLLVESYSGMPDTGQMVRAIEEDPGVVAAAPVHLGHAMIRTDDTATGVRVKGIVPEYEARVTQAVENMMLGDMTALEPEVLRDATPEGSVSLDRFTRPLPGVVLGKELAKKLFLINVYENEYEEAALSGVLGERLEIITPLEEEGPLGKRWRSATFEVTGVFDSGLYEYDSNYALIGLDQAQYLFNLKSGVTRIEVRLKNLDEASVVASRLFESLDRRFNRFFETTTWMQMNKTFFLALRIEKIAMFVILVLIILVAAFNIASTLIMVVMEKTRDIGVLRSIGASRRSILTIFVIEGAVIGIIGLVLGLIGGIGLCLFLEQYGLELPGHGSIYYIDRLPVEMRLTDIMLICVLTFATCVLSSFYPAWQAARLDPVEAIRYE